MNNRRRRADNFTDSLYGFHQSSDEKQNQNEFQTYSEDSLDTDSMRKRECKNEKFKCSKNNSRGCSIILAGNLANDQYISSYNLEQDAEEKLNNPCTDKQLPLRDISNIPEDISYLSLDLNKCINLFHNEHLKKESNTFEECLSNSSLLTNRNDKDVNPGYSEKNKILGIQCKFSIYPRSLSSNSLKYTVVPEKGIRKSKSCSYLHDSRRDKNHNINQMFSVQIKTIGGDIHEKIKMIVPPLDALSLSESSASSNKNDGIYPTTGDQKNDSINGSTGEEFNPIELKKLLHLLHEPSKLPEKACIQEPMLRRLSMTFQNSPRSFTERLLTIIEESVIDSDYNISSELSRETSIHKFTTEVRKICKCIEDETVPEWPPSPSKSTCMKEETRENKSHLSEKSLDEFLSPNKHSVTFFTPRRNIKSPKKTYRCTPKKTSVVFDTNSSMLSCSIKHDNTSTFESLETYCKKLYPDEYKTPTGKNLQSPLRHMTNILHKCDEQMASLLEDSTKDFLSPKKFPLDLLKEHAGTYTPTDQYNKVSEIQNLQNELLAQEKRDNNRLKNITSKQYSKRYEMIEPDDLERSLIYEIAKKRQRCLDTVNTMREIDADSKLTASQQTCSNIVINKCLPVNNDAKWMETLMSCKKYQDSLEKYKPLLNLLWRQSSKSRPSRNENESSRAKEAGKANVTKLRAKSSATIKKNKSPLPAKCSTFNKMSVVSKPKLFVTPGKAPVSNTVRRGKRTYFPDSTANTSKQKELHINPHAKHIYRQMGLTSNSVISPVGMYIRGTDSHLLKNVQPKTYDMLLTPNKKVTVSAAPKVEMKFKLSPNKEPEKMFIETAIKDKNNPEKFSHPKVNYKLPSQIRTIKKTENRKVGNRVNELLRSTRDKVVIRHEGRTKTVETGSSEQPEIRYDSAEESVHIEQIARKTCFFHVQKD